MRNFVIASLVLHGVIGLFMVIGIKDPFQKSLINNQPLLIDFVEISEKSAAPKLAPVQKVEDIKTEAQITPEKPKESALDPQEPSPSTEKSAKAQEKHEPSRDLKAESEPIPDKNHKKKEPPKKEDVKKPKPKEKVEIKKKEGKSLKKNNKAEVNLKDNKKSSSQNTDKKPDKKKSSKDDLNDLLQKEAEESDSNNEGAPAQRVGPIVTASEIDVLRQHIRKCWVVPSGIKGAKDMTVDIRMEIAKDGTVTKADIINKNRMNVDGSFRAAAESAQRAVLDPQCNPLPLPKNKYEQWKDLEFSFNPRDMY